MNFQTCSITPNELFCAEEFDTFKALSAIYSSCLRGETIAPESKAHKFLLALQHRFEVFGRIYSSYGADFRKRGEGFDNLGVYSLLALNLIHPGVVFNAGQRLAALNTALKISDLLNRCAGLMSGPEVRELSETARQTINRELRTKYESFGLKLPAS